MKRSLVLGVLMFSLGVAVGPGMTEAEAPRTRACARPSTSERLAAIDRGIAALQCRLRRPECPVTFALQASVAASAPRSLRR